MYRRPCVSARAAWGERLAGRALGGRPCPYCPRFSPARSSGGSSRGAAPSGSRSARRRRSRRSIWKGERDAPVSSADTPVGNGRAEDAQDRERSCTSLSSPSTSPAVSRSSPARSTRTTWRSPSRAGRHVRPPGREAAARTSSPATRLAGVDDAAPLHKALGFTRTGCRRSSRRRRSSSARPPADGPANRALQLPPRRRRQLRRARRDRAARRCRPTSARTSST